MIGANDERKTQLASQLQAARENLSTSISGLREDINISRSFAMSFRRHKAAWLGGSALLGWVLARLPARKKTVKVYIDKRDKQKIKEQKKGGVLLAVAKFAVGIAKPAITAYATKKVADLAATAEKSNERRGR
jgi:hypothetical protein